MTVEDIKNIINEQIKVYEQHLEKNPGDEMVSSNIDILNWLLRKINE